MSKADASDKTQSFDTRVAHQVLLDGLETIRDIIKEATIERKVEVGSVLWDLGDRVKEVLDEIKKDVRTEAVKERGGQVGTTTIEGDDMGEAAVTIPSASLRIPKGKDIAGIKQALGSRFSFFFEEIVTHKPQKEFEDRVAEVKDALEQNPARCGGAHGADPACQFSTQQTLQEGHQRRQITRRGVPRGAPFIRTEHGIETDQTKRQRKRHHAPTNQRPRARRQRCRIRRRTDRREAWAPDRRRSSKIWRVAGSTREGLRGREDRQGTR